MRLLKISLLLFFTVGGAFAGVERIMPEHYEFLHSEAKGKNDLIISKLLSGCTHVWNKAEELKYDSKTRTWIHYSFGEPTLIDQTGIKSFMNFLLARQYWGLATSTSLSQPDAIQCTSVLCSDTRSPDTLDIRFKQCLDTSSGKVRANVFGTVWLPE